MNPQKLTLRYSIIIIAMLISFIGCEKDDEKIVEPTMPSAEVFSLGSNAATIKSDLIESKSPILSAGLCWGTNPNPTIANANVFAFLSDSAMYCRVEDLSPNSTYYGKLYAFNSDGVWYGDEFSFTTNPTVVDIDGNVYNTVKIGNQVWMVENLKTTRFNDGADIPYINSDWSNLETSGYCFYDFSVDNKALYGALYNWPAVNSSKLCPNGWHIPSDSEWNTLINYLGGESYAGSFIKHSGLTSWTSSSSTSNNFSGFTALPSGSSSSVIGYFIGKGSEAFWWTSTVDFNLNPEHGYNIYRATTNGSPSIIRNGFLSSAGSGIFLSVRCIKN